jgi:2-dehydropantoate 2-reductase
MKIAVLGAGAMGGLFGGMLAHAGNDVSLVDVRDVVVEAIRSQELRLESKPGDRWKLAVRATSRPSEVGPVELLIVFVKSYDTEAAVRSAEPMITENTIVLTLQNGWGNAARIAGIVGEPRLLAGLTYHSATVLGPGHVYHAGRGRTFVGRLDGQITPRLCGAVDLLNSAGIEASATPNIRQEIWSKLALNACTLPTSALLRVFAGQLLNHEGSLELMRAILRETVAVANAQGLTLDEEERWEAITALLKRSAEARASMLQDVENRRRTEIEVVNGAVVQAGQRLGIPTPYNHAMVALIRSLQESFNAD